MENGSMDGWIDDGWFGFSEDQGQGVSWDSLG